MPGMFDDLIPGGGSVPPPPPMDEAPAPAAAAPPPASNMFEDLVPRAQAGEETAAPQTEAPPANMFADLIPKEEPAGVLSTFGAEAAKSAIGGPGEILKGLGVGAGTVGTEPIEQGAMYRTGAAMQKYADSWGATEASKAAHPIAATAGSTVGGFAPALPLLGASALGAPALPVLAAGAGMFGAMGAGNAFSEALLKGADENTAAKAAGLNAIVAGGLGSIPLGTMLAPVRAFAPELTGWAAQTLEKALVSGVVFTSVGEAQEFLGRQIAQNFYDPNAGYTPDVNRLLGSMLGGGLIGTVTPRMIHNERAGTAVTDEQLKSIADNIMKEMPPPVVVVDAAAKAADVEAPKINAQTTEATGIASASKAEEGWLAYHGSAAHFDQFDGGFKGTGEGAGTFGSAEAYVGEAKGTGEDYQNRMGGYRYEGQPYDATNPEHLASFLIKQQGTREAAAQFADQEAAKGTIGSAWKISSEIYGKAAALLGSDTPIAPLERIGNLYSVRVTRPTDHFIDWDQPMSAQPKYVQDRVMKAIPEGQDANITRRELADPNLLGGDFYRNLASLLGSPEAASEALHKVGIAGNRYLDQFSRGTSDRIKLLEGFQTDDAGAIGRANELLKIITDPAAVAETQAGIQRLTDQIASREAELEKLRSGTGLTRNAAVFKADDVKITHRNGEPLTTAEARAIDDIQHGAVVEDQGDGVAIVNGREVGSIPADELRKQFGKPSANDNVIDLSAERRKRDNGYSVNDNAMQSMGVKDFPDTPMTEVTTGARETTSKLFGGTTPPEAKASATAADHYYRRLKSLIGLRELLAMNPQNKPLQDYGIHLDHMLRYAAERIVNAEDTVKLATKLNSAGKTALNKMIDKYVNMSYLTAEERAKGLVRRPNQDEIRDMIASSQMDARGAKVFDRMVKDLDSFAQDMLDVMREKTVNLGPKEMAKENARLDALEKMYKERPYFPITRFGLYTVLIRGPEGNKFYRTETPREQKKLAAQLQKSLKDGEVLTLNKLPESSTPFAGLPVQMLDMIQKQFLQGAQKPDELRAALEQLKYESSPVRGITAKFANKALTPGYSQDFLRSYANFFFHGSRYLSRMRYVDLMKNAMTELRTSSLTNENPVRRSEVADFVEKHYKGILDPTTDWSIPRAFLFHMVLGFRVASAATNLTQTLISTIPHLSAEFGDFKTMKATMKAATDIKNFYSRMKTMEQTGPEFRAMQELMNLGTIRGAFAPELAMISENRNLLGGYGGEIGKKIHTALTHYMKASASFFEVSEQFNRRVAGMATFDLALKNPDAKFVKAATGRDPALVAELVNKGIPLNEANAIVAAKVMIDRTQGQYTREYRPRYMSGPIGSTIFTFKLFAHQMLWNMWNHPAAGMRMLLTMGFLGGLQGIPGFQDLNGILKAAAYWLFGKDFDLEDEARRFAVDTLGMKGEGVMNDPFTITKGFASRGYGIPALLDSIGEWSGIGKLPIPETDRSAAVSLGNLLPIDFGQLTANVRKNPGDAFASATSRGMGALGSYAYNTYKAIADVRDHPEDFRRWEKVAPTFLANISHAARVYREGAETGQTGSAVVRFDPHDTEHMMEVLAMSLGYTPFRVMREYTRLRAEKEATTFWEVRREMLLNQFWSAMQSSDGEDKARVTQSIRNFNSEIRGTDARAMVISGDTLTKSMQNRSMTKAKQEVGLPQSTMQIPIVRGIRHLFPGAVVDTRKTN